MIDWEHLNESLSGLGFPVLDDYHMERDHEPPYVVPYIGFVWHELYKESQRSVLSTICEIRVAVHLPNAPFQHDVMAVAEKVVEILERLPNYVQCSIRIVWPDEDENGRLKPDKFTSSDFRLLVCFNLVMDTKEK